MTRNKKLLLNMLTGVGYQATTVVCGFIFTRILLVTYGSSVNGLISSITQFLGFISFLEMGIGPVIQSNLYKPLMDNDDVQISKIVKSSKFFFRRIAYIFIVYILVVCFIFLKFINTVFTPTYIVSLILILSISTFAQYFFGIPYQLLLTADQKSYIQVTVTTLTLIINTVLCIILMKSGLGIQVVKVVTAVVYLIRPIFFALYVKKHYNLDKKIVYREEPIRQKWNGFAQHLCAIVTNGTDIIILTFLSTLENVSIYNVYYMIVFGVTNLLLSFANGLAPFWGSMIARGEKEVLVKSFSFIEWLFHTIVTFLFTLTIILIIPFIKIYTKNIDGVNYIQPLFASIMVLSFAFRCLRVPYFDMINAAGHYKQTQKGAIVTMFLNIGISIPFVYVYGLVGVAIGTFVAFSFHTVYFVFYLSHNILCRQVQHFIRHVVLDFVEAVLCALFWYNIQWDILGYIQWVVLGLSVAGSCILVIFLLNLIFYRDYILILFRKLKKHR